MSTSAVRADAIEPALPPVHYLPTIEVFESIELGDRCFTFRVPLRARREYMDRMFVYQVSELGIVVAGATIAEVRTSLAEYIAFLMDHYAAAPDGGLDASARDLKGRLLAWVSEGPGDAP